ncbi:hypothetical protein TIFTF001_020633 [Ficus carica]|uniref:Uncharacterized protein n=1 Tax=Ficus carica TaxID=3494 RepID=A0AA88DDU5_FICCA|nr:hypothetical protein TIFTF001_020633 [Ficus carica]
MEHSPVQHERMCGSYLRVSNSDTNVSDFQETSPASEYFTVATYNSEATNDGESHDFGDGTGFVD